MEPIRRKNPVLRACLFAAAIELVAGAVLIGFIFIVGRIVGVF